MNCKILASAVVTPALVACATTKRDDFEVTTKTVAPASQITWIGQETALRGDGKLRVGDKLPETTLTNLKMEPEKAFAHGTVKIIDTIPSIDTPVCEQQTHQLSEAASLDPRVERITISPDLPYAIRRFRDESKLTNVAYYSDYRDGAFGLATGLRIERNGLLARTVIVLDQEGVVRHLQIVPEITQLPDMAKAFAVANELAAKL